MLFSGSFQMQDLHNLVLTETVTDSPFYIWWVWIKFNVLYPHYWLIFAYIAQRYHMSLHNIIIIKKPTQFVDVAWLRLVNISKHGSTNWEIKSSELYLSVLPTYYTHSISDHYSPHTHRHRHREAHRLHWLSQSHWKFPHFSVGKFWLQAQLQLAVLRI